MRDPMTTAEAAEELEISPRWLARLVKRRAIVPEIKLPGPTGPYVFEAKTVAAYKAEREADK